MTEVLPNIFIVGAAKCGTTSLANRLACHPDIVLARDKEPEIFSKEDLFTFPGGFLGHPESSVRDLETCDVAELLARRSRTAFSDAKAPFRLDATPSYLISSVARQRIKAHCPDARIIVMLREPTQRLLSAYWFFVMHAIAYSSFSKWLQDDRYGVLNVWMGRYAEHLAAWIRDFGKDAVFVRDIDDLKHDQSKIIRDILVHIGADPDTFPYEQPWTKENVSSYPRYPDANLFLNRVIRATTRYRADQRAAYRRTQAQVPAWKDAVDSWIRRLPRSVRARLPIRSQSGLPELTGKDREMVSWMERYYRASNRDLNEIMGWDILSCWYGDTH